MKVIFLDIDGVLNTANYTLINEKSPSNYVFGGFDPACVNRLNQITKATEAKLVLSSSWRKLFEIETIRKLFSYQGIEAELIDYTISNSRRTRGFEIESWLNENNVESFVILDDDSDMENLMPYLVQTSYLNGLEECHVNKAIDILKGAS